MQNRVVATIAICMVVATTRAAMAVPEVCGNGVDDNANGYADEGCFSNSVMGICESPISCKITGDVAPKTGAFVYQLPPDIDPSVPFGPKLQFKRTYMSMYSPPAASYRTSMGARWQHNWQSWLDKSGSTVVVHMPTGQDVLYTLSVSGLLGYDYYVPQAGVHVTTPPNGTGAYLRQATTAPNKWELRTLTGEKYIFDWAAPVGKLIEIDDTLATPNKVIIAYNTSGTNIGQINTITDASGHKRLLFSYTSGLVTTVNYQTGSASTWTTRVALTFTYAGMNPTTVKIAGTTIQTNVYPSNYLTSVQDGGGNHLIDVKYVGATPGMVANITTGQGGIGYEFNSSNSQCAGQTALYSNIANATVCSIDADCGSTYKCGGKTGAGATGTCYRAARCLTTTSPSEDLITSATAITPCTGPCAPVSTYSWNTSNLDLLGVQRSTGGWTSLKRDSNGMVILMSEGDTDADPTNTGGTKTWIYYSNVSLPGRVTEQRSHSSVRGTEYPCDDSTTAGCRQTFFTWNSDGLLGTKAFAGYSYDSTNSPATMSAATSYSYDSVGRLLSVDGPLSGSDDVTSYSYWSSADVLKDGYLNLVQAKTDSTHFVVTTLDGYDVFGNAGAIQDPDLTWTCRTWDPNRNYLSVSREAMAGQPSCTTTDPTDMTTSYLRDSALRLTKTTRPLADCAYTDYDAMGRTFHTKLRDDCVSTNPGDTRTNSYDSDGRLSMTELSDSGGTVTSRSSSTYLDAGQLGSRVNPVSGYGRAYTYYGDGLVDSIVGENSIGKIETTYDQIGRRAYEDRYSSVSSSTRWTLSYPGLSPTRQSSLVTDPASKAVGTDYDDLGRLNRIVSPDSGTTIQVYDAASRVSTVVDAYGTTGQVSHTFTYDYIGRRLTEDYDDVLDDCTDGTGHVVEVTLAYDQSPVSCPAGATCSRQVGRLAYVKEKMMCDASQPDYTLDQEVFYAYDDAGRLIQEYIRDDSGRRGVLSYAWDKNGHMTQVTAPSGAAQNYNYGGAGNSDTNRITVLQRSLTGIFTTLATNAKWASFGPLTQYDQSNTVGGSPLRATLSRNLAYRMSSVDYSTVDGINHRTHIDYSEDEKGRYTKELYTNVNPGVLSDYIQYDWLDRAWCDTSTSYSGTCPSSGSSLKTNVSITTGVDYNSSNDRVAFSHQDSTYHGTLNYTATQISGADKISSIQQSGMASAISYGWDYRGDRTYDDDGNTANDRRDYTYDGRRRVHTISSLTAHCRPFFGCSWQRVVITYGYDHRDRVVFRAYHNIDAGFTSQTYYYYDEDDRLLEVKFLPTSDPATYTIYDYYWIDQRPVAYWATDQAGTTARYYMHADAANRVIEVHDWPTTGDANDLWSLNPETFGWDRVVNGSIYQPLRLNNMIYDDGTASSYDTLTLDRPYLLINHGMHFDPMTETFVQRTGLWPSEPYGVKRHNVAAGVAPNTRGFATMSASQAPSEWTTRKTCVADVPGRAQGLSAMAQGCPSCSRAQPTLMGTIDSDGWSCWICVSDPTGDPYSVFCLNYPTGVGTCAKSCTEDHSICVCAYGGTCSGDNEGGHTAGDTLLVNGDVPPPPPRWPWQTTITADGVFLQR